MDVDKRLTGKVGSASLWWGNWAGPGGSPCVKAHSARGTPGHPAKPHCQRNEWSECLANEGQVNKKSGGWGTTASGM